jgi:exonuclease SbcC
MRPLELRLKGFRSYRTERLIDFRDLELVAIVGDTGAGKSSLLEAITWALYGASTWSKQAHGELLAQGASQMTVELTFQAGGESWQIMRTHPRAGAGKVELRCLSDSSREGAGGAAEVRERVRQVVGLDYEMFCSCVLLPQGKFERLLKETPARRTAVLKSILRLEQLGRMRELTGEAVERLRQRELEIADARVRFSADPAGDLSAARDEIAALEPERERLRAALSELDDLEREAADAEDQAEEASSATVRLTDARGRRPAELRELAARAEELAGPERELAEELARAQDALAELAEHGRRRKQEGLDPVSLATAGERLKQLRDTLGALARERSQLEEMAAEHEGSRQECERAQALAKQAKERLAALEEELEQAEQGREAAEDEHRALQAALQELESACARRQQAADHLSAAEGAHRKATAEENEAKRALSAAGSQVEEAREEHERLSRAEAAAHLAAGCRPGDPCPVCARALPASFEPPRSEGLEAASRRLREAQERLSDAQRELQRAALAREHSERELESARRDLQEATAAAVEAQRALEPAGEAPQARLAELADAIEASRGRIKALREKRPQVESAHRQADAALAAALATARARAREISEAQSRMAQSRRSIADLAGALPAVCKLPADGREPTNQELECAERALAAAREQASELEKRAEATRDELQSLKEHEAQLRERREREVRTPTALVRQALVGLRSELPEAVRRSLPEPPDAERPEQLIAAAEAIDAAAATRLAELAEIERAAKQSSEGCRQRAAQILESSGHGDQAGLRAHAERVAGELHAVRERARRAERELSGARALDDLRRRASELREGLEGLREALGDGAFVRYVVERRQRALLAHASRALGEMTGRYAFTEDFRILDAETGQARSPDTLSGGETFLASLALALGLVEVAERSGGDLRALFLDEGFGALDAAALDAALDALQLRARSGRLISLISHVPTIAERIDTVLQVRGTVEGSEVVRLTGEERARMVEEGLVAAVGEI